ncbi:hypothetical protein LINPERHAP1_LOCUS35227, partial [Linum perenne]
MHNATSPNVVTPTSPPTVNSPTCDTVCHSPQASERTFASLD